ncbi:hypothetical protein [Nocardia vaccinii]|uniref:hypothetical protein n=1 Tax=Nocardia vaccinii TaxID=1822 RepID=UPI0008306C43|nr:hypothetical protein [Nocardia vaccinii]
MRTPENTHEHDDPVPADDTTVVPLRSARQRRARPAPPPSREPEQLSFDDDWIEYWRTITDTWAPLDRDQISAIAAIVEQIDIRRAAADNDAPRRRRPEAA